MGGKKRPDCHKGVQLQDEVDRPAPLLHHSLPKVDTMQNQTNRQKKNIWLILLVNIIFNATPKNNKN